jgi:hypothetical protein
MRKTNATLSTLICVAAMAWAGSAAALNPQPLPPRRFPTLVTVHHTQGHLNFDRHRSSALSRNGFNRGPHFLNPQPLPPG